MPILLAAIESGAAGLVVSNTTISREGLSGKVPEGSGGVSGAPLFERSTKMLRLLHQAHGARLSFIGVGGVMDAAGARAKLEAGADLLQCYTGFVYGGPRFPRKLLGAL